MSQSKEETSLQGKPKTTVAQSLITGSVAGAVEVLVDHPLWTIKTRLQNGEPFSLKPSVLYTGILANAASMVPITAIKETSSKPMGFREAGKHLYATGGIHRFFKGGLPRALRVVSAVTIISGVNATMEEKFSELNSEATYKR